MKTARIENLYTSQRIFRLAVSLGLTISVLATSGPLGWMAILPLLGIYPGLTAFTGYCPLYAAMDETGYGSMQPVPA